MVIAVPTTQSQRDALSSVMLVHVAPASKRDQIIQSGTGPLPSYANCHIHLKAGQGWSVAPFRLLRDYSVLDPYLTKLKAYGCYTYFFIGAPSGWARLKNLGLKAYWYGLGDGDVAFSVKGRDLLAQADLSFQRIDDNVLVIRGDYVGPALVTP